MLQDVISQATNFLLTNTVVWSIPTTTTVQVDHPAMHTRVVTTNKPDPDTQARRKQDIIENHNFCPILEPSDDDDFEKIEPGGTDFPENSLDNELTKPDIDLTMVKESPKAEENSNLAKEEKNLDDNNVDGFDNAKEFATKRPLAVPAPKQKLVGKEETTGSKLYHIIFLVSLFFNFLFISTPAYEMGGPTDEEILKGDKVAYQRGGTLFHRMGEQLCKTNWLPIKYIQSSKLREILLMSSESWPSSPPASPPSPPPPPAPPPALAPQPGHESEASQSHSIPPPPLPSTPSPSPPPASAQDTSATITVRPKLMKFLPRPVMRK